MIVKSFSFITLQVWSHYKTPLSPSLWSYNPTLQASLPSCNTLETEGVNGGLKYIPTNHSWRIFITFKYLTTPTLQAFIATRCYFLTSNPLAWGGDIWPQIQFDQILALLLFWWAALLIPIDWSKPCHGGWWGARVMVVHFTHERSSFLSFLSFAFHHMIYQRIGKWQ